RERATHLYRTAGGTARTASEPAARSGVGRGSTGVAGPGGPQRHVRRPRTAAGDRTPRQGWDRGRDRSAANSAGTGRSPASEGRGTEVVLVTGTHFGITSIATRSDGHAPAVTLWQG